jgi:asparagine synthase (glutamine-hydrolysing)
LPEATKELLRAMRAPLDRTALPALQRMRESDIETYLPGDVLAKVDRMSMRHALEVRAPLLGRRVADFAMRMAADDLCAEGGTKRVLKQVAARYIPRAWLERPKKGFAVPTDDDWNGAKLAAEVRDLLTGPACRLQAWIAPERLEKFTSFHLKTPRFWHLWEVYVLEQWLRSHAGRAA